MTNHNPMSICAYPDCTNEVKTRQLKLCPLCLPKWRSEKAIEVNSKRDYTKRNIYLTPQDKIDFQRAGKIQEFMMAWNN